MCSCAHSHAAGYPARGSWLSACAFFALAVRMTQAVTRKQTKTCTSLHANNVQVGTLLLEVLVDGGEVGDKYMHAFFSHPPTLHNPPPPHFPKSHARTQARSHLRTPAPRGWEHASTSSPEFPVQSSPSAQTSHSSFIPSHAKVAAPTLESMHGSKVARIFIDVVSHLGCIRHIGRSSTRLSSSWSNTARAKMVSMHFICASAA
jgi:hypothetical protein